jgi:hypothetical protein
VDKRISNAVKFVYPRNSLYLIFNEIREAARGGFYRVYGNIRRFVPK